MKYLIKGVFIFFSWLIFINSLPYDIAEIDFSVGEAWYRMFIASTILFSQASFFDILAVREETLTKKNGAFFVMHVLSTVMVVVFILCFAVEATMLLEIVTITNVSDVLYLVMDEGPFSTIFSITKTVSVPLSRFLKAILLVNLFATGLDFILHECLIVWEENKKAPSHQSPTKSVAHV